MAGVDHGGGYPNSVLDEVASGIERLDGTALLCSLALIVVVDIPTLYLSY
jgi:hypothetical protein